ncbi:unannotated protein [freshwater metagenome]|uniref:Unannotated protein n=1 Tax=freshwater metagenome TaxID=449393 RepID=A0A6J6MPH2_9ZZZZ
MQPSDKRIRPQPILYGFRQDSAKGLAINDRGLDLLRRQELVVVVEAMPIPGSAGVSNHVGDIDGAREGRHLGSNRQLVVHRGISDHMSDSVFVAKSSFF